MHLKAVYLQKGVPELLKTCHLKNVMEVPRVEKIVINVGIGKSKDDARFKDVVLENLKMISGQKPSLTEAKKSISNFKIRKGLAVGVRVTLRGKRMYDFLEKLIHVSLPRIRDFQGLDTRIIDKSGNMNIGFREQIAFPEIQAEGIEKLHGVQVTVSVKAKSREHALELYKFFGFPFKK
ncbi:MAG: 50S ribosomal protein L5 [Parcubacteria group bacterium]|nr:50S ribosomal protein L5 [Parcubacteria group bacterium]